MTLSVYDHSGYKSYLESWIKSHPRGEKSRLAESVRCHLAYVSQVLHAHADFSLEQADLLNDHFKHSEDEADYFILLVSHARAGSASLRKKFEVKIRKTLQERARLENRIKDVRSLPEENQAVFYSAWHYAAIHLLIAIPDFQTREVLAEHLKLPLSQVARALDFLVRSGLAQQEGNRYHTGQVSLYLKNDSPWIARQHSNWRAQAIRSIEQQKPEDFHYTSVVTMSPEDVPAVQKIMSDAIEKIRAVVKPSLEKAAFCYNLDFFEI